MLLLLLLLLMMMMMMIKLVYDHMSAEWPAQLTVSAFNRLGQYASSPDNKCYAELAVSTLAMTVTIASTHCAHLRRDGQAELAWVVD